MNTLIIETVDSNGTEWGISFTNYNPEPEDYFKMPNSDSAFALQKKLNGLWPKKSLMNITDNDAEEIGYSNANEFLKSNEEYADKVGLLSLANIKYLYNAGYDLGI